MNKNQKSHFFRLPVAIAAGLAVSTMASRAQGIQASATLVGTAGTGGTYDYVLTVDNSATATTSIEGFWYAWIPGHFFLPSVPSTASGEISGWTATVDGDSIQFQGAAGDAIAPGGSASFSFVTTDSPTALAGTSDGFPIDDSVTYPGPINFSSASPNEEITVLSAPEPSALALLGAGSLCFLAGGRCWLRSGGAT
jgi:hypothetical protein